MLNANSGKKQVKAQESVYPWQDQFWWDNGSSEHQTGLRGLQWGKKRHSEGDSASDSTQEKVRLELTDEGYKGDSAKLT